MLKLSIKMALRNWRKALLVGIVLFFAGSILIYYQTILWEMAIVIPGKGESISNIAQITPEGVVKIPRSPTESLISALTLIIVFVAGMFHLNILVIDMINKNEEYKALQIIGVSEEHIELFPLLYSVLSCSVSAVLIGVFWFLIFPKLKPFTGVSTANPGLIVIVIVVFLIIGIIIGTKAGDLAKKMQ